MKRSKPHRQSQGPSHRGGPWLERVEDYFVGRFSAMGGPCSVLIDSDDRRLAREVLDIADAEAGRVERKFSRYRNDNLIYEINHADGRAVQVDEETALLVDYAATCWGVSDGLFDITSGALRRVWRFDGGRVAPTADAIAACLRDVGWERVTWVDHTLALAPGMEIDLGGIGKEYAVDRTAGLIATHTQTPCLVNFGGDIFASGLRRGKRTWAVGIDDPERSGTGALYRLDVSRAAGLATSGDARRYVLWQGKRLGHILNPKTGWPITDAPRSVTVAAPTCLEAGTLSTLAYLQGPGAQTFLEAQGVSFWLI